MNAEQIRAFVIRRLMRISLFFDMKELMHKNQIYKVAIYGGGELGTALYEVLYSSRVPVSYIIDKNISLHFRYQDVSVIEPKQINQMEPVDAIIVTPYANGQFESIQINLLRQGCRIRCISIRDLLIDVDDYVLFQKISQQLSQQGTDLLMMNLHMPLYHRNPSVVEYLMQRETSRFNILFDNMELLRTYYEDLQECTDEYISSVFTTKSPPVSSIRKEDGVFYMADVQHDYYNVVNHCRITAGQPEHFDHTIYFFGNCAAFGIFTDDGHTIESYLQKKLQQKLIGGKRYRVMNCANFQNERKALERVLKQDYCCGDIVVFLSAFLTTYQYYFDRLWFYDLKSAFDRPHKYGDREIFFDGYHVNHRGYDLMADKIYEVIAKERQNQNQSKSCEEGCRNIVKVVPVHPMPDGGYSPYASYELQGSEEMQAYIQYLKQEKFETKGVKGCIVMNSNPFTLGHRFLVESALQECDNLYVFVVEEDCSVFSFEDRMEMVRKGVADLKNVKVLKSGNYIISTETFPEYFIKEKYNMKIDASKDLNLFTSVIAPVLHIKIRFAGKEPLCNVTRQYNQAMKECLPPRGVQFREIERRTTEDNVVISASLVRELLREKRYEAIAKFLPETTIQYLKENGIYVR